MGSLYSVVKVSATSPLGLPHTLILGAQTLAVPAIISLILFVVSTYVLYPLWQRYRNRYSQYLPLDTLSSQTSSLRARLQNGLGSLLLPSAWRQRARDRLVVGGDTGSDVDYDSDEGEELGAVDESRRRALESRGTSIDSNRRLSRE